MRVLNLYAGIGGNRKLWTDVEVTAVELDESIAAVYQSFFPDDTVIIGDAHQYLLEHYKEFDFIWASPPCPSHSEIRRCGSIRGQYPALYPDIRLWEEITLLKHHTQSKWVVENVKPYYTPIIEPSFKLDRHFFWSNFYAPPHKFSKREVKHCFIHGNSEIFGFNLDGIKLSKRKDQVLRNCVNPEVGKYILDTAMEYEIKSEQLELF